MKNSIAKLPGTILWSLLIVGVYIVGLWVPVMEVDAAQYASMGAEMLENGSYLHLFNRGQDYLDKPPLLFWMVTLSYKVFGLSTVAFKLPSLLFGLVALLSTYKLGTLLYNRQTGRWAALMLATTQAWFMMMIDPRTDMLLTGSVIFAIWQLVAYRNTGDWQHILLGSVGIGLAMLAKGPIGLMVPGLALGTHWLLRKDWSAIFRWQWILVLGIVALMLAPMAYGLYTQFDLHPEKEVYGLTGISGLKFYFWDQSFGRLTGDSQFVNQVGQSQQTSDPFFFIHTFLWSFFPWSWLFIIAIARTIRQRFIEGWRGITNKEYITWGGTILPWIALSFSGYKLPHYIFVFYPLVAIMTANSLSALSTKRWLLIGQYIIAGISIIAIGLLLLYIFPLPSLWLLLGIITILVFYWLLQAALPQWLTIGIATMLLLNLTLNGHFYPTLLTYQVPSEVVRHADKYGADVDRLFQWPTVSYNFEFYLGRRQSTTDIYQLKSNQAQLLLPLSAWSTFTKQGIPHTVVYDSIPGTRVTRLTLPFLLPTTRADHQQYWRLIAL